MRDGSSLEFAATALCRDIQRHPEDLQRIGSDWFKVLRVGSACTGSGQDHFILDALSSGLEAKLGVKLLFEHTYKIEIKPGKLEYLQQTFDEPGCCLFRDVRRSEPNAIIVGARATLRAPMLIAFAARAYRTPRAHMFAFCHCYDRFFAITPQRQT